MNGFDGQAREAFNVLSDSLNTCRNLLWQKYKELPAYKLEGDGADLLERVDSLDKAIRGLYAINNDMEDAGIE